MLKRRRSLLYRAGRALTMVIGLGLVGIGLIRFVYEALQRIGATP